MFKNREGQKIPQVDFHLRRNHEWVDISSDEIFNNKTVVVFALPGAFTPTCSSTHVPRYNQLTPALKQHGVDEVLCISVNDALCYERVAERAKCLRCHLHPGRQRRFQRGHGYAGRQGRSWLRQALLEIFHAGKRRRD